MRRKVYLNGEWEFMPDFEARSPEKAVAECVWESEKIRVPSSWKWKINMETDYEPYDMFKYPGHWDKAGSGVLGRTFEVHPEAGERVFLIFKGVLQHWQVFINDVKVLESQEAFLPMEMDITDFALKDCSNTLKVWCGPFKTINTSLGKKQVGLIGSWFAQSSMGIWQDVFIEYRNAKYLIDPVVRTSYRENMLEAEISAVGIETETETVLFSVLDGMQEVKTFEGRLHKDEDGNSIFKGSINWNDAVLWMPDEPHLYVLRAELKTGNNIEERLDTTFGFREIWCESNKFYINGIRINLRGDSWHYQGFVYQTKEYALNWYKLCKDTGMNFVRLHAMPYPEMFLEAADEVGMLIIDESAIYGSSKKMQADNEEFIENCEMHLQRLVKRDRNHPSVIMWSMQNEMRWVDGRDGYKLQMKKLILAMKALDSTRPVSFDGDNRLVASEDMEVVSMHYNIDGTVASWDKSRPLAFGEHGKWHYVSPQVASSIVGGKAYESIDSCLLNMGREEELFIEYARKEDVTSIGPFNIGYYMMKPMPSQDLELCWEITEGPGVKPRLIRKYSMTINNGLLKNYPMYTPNASYEAIKRSFLPLAIIADEYDSSFFECADLIRRFSIYNDSYSAVEMTLEYHMKRAAGEILKTGSENFSQLPGERENIKLEFKLPAIKVQGDGLMPEIFTLELKLLHDGKEVYTLVKQYKVYSSQNLCGTKLNNKILYIGEKTDYDILKDFTGAAFHKGKVSANTLYGIDIVILGRNYKGSIKEMQDVFQEFVSAGGFLLIMEQDREAPGELILSGRKYTNALIGEQGHPVFKGLTDEDFANWCVENVNEPEGYRPVVNAFEKPEKGDLKVLLECGEGDFGWGGLLWSAMLEYRIGKGMVILQQLDITRKFNELPQTRILLSNILQYASFTKKETNACKTGMLVKDDSTTYEFFERIGLKFDKLTQGTEINKYDFIIVEPKAIDCALTCQLKEFMQSGGRLMVLPLSPANVQGIKRIAGDEITIREKTAYQIKALEHQITVGIPAFDCYHFENVTYTPANKVNTVIAEHSICLNGSRELFTNINTPWEDMFVKNLAGENIKQATVKISEDRAFDELCYCCIFEMGEGSMLLCQLKTDIENSKLIRIYSRLLVNMGAEIKANLLSYIKEEKDFGIGTFMALPYETHNDFAAEEVYFSDENFVLNNLGEGVYGWMKRVEKKNGFISIEGSAGKTYFLTLFIQSEINRNPLKREAGELPDSSIVPDFLLSTNCNTKLFINGKKVFKNMNINSLKEFKIEDIMLDKGINRLTVVIFGGIEDIRLNGCFINKYGDFINDLRYILTLD